MARCVGTAGLALLVACGSSEPAPAVVDVAAASNPSDVSPPEREAAPRPTASVLHASEGAPTGESMPPPESQARAQALFDEARRLLEKGDFSRACPKLRESFSLDPAAGTALNLADCYRQLGDRAQACEAYDRASGLTSSSDERRRFIDERKRSLGCR